MNRPLARLTKILIIAGAVALLAAACGDSASTTDVGAGPAADGEQGSPAATAPTTTPPTTTTGLPLGAGPYPIADITVTVHPDGTDSAPYATYQLSCLGDTATVTGNASGSASSMCLALGQPGVRDLLLNGAPGDRICTEIYGGPDVATFTGTLDGDPVDFTADRVDGCSINDWESTLVDLLP